MKKVRFKYNLTYLKTKQSYLFHKMNLFLIKNELVVKSLRQKSLLNLERNKCYYLSKYFKFCLITGRVRGVNTLLTLSRHEFKSFFKQQLLTGIFKTNW